MITLDPMAAILAGQPVAGLTLVTSSQVSAFCGDIRTANAFKYSSTKRAYLRKLAAAVQEDSSPTRGRRHRMITGAEITEKYTAETGLDLLGRTVQPPEEPWTRPRASQLYARLCLREAGKPTIADYEGDDLGHLAWLVEEELADVDDDGRIWLLSDADDASRRYPGAGPCDDRAKIGRTWTADEADGMVLYAWDRITAGSPLVPLTADQVREMDCKAGIRFSAHEAARQVNAGIIGPDMDARCHCTGRDLVEHAWDLLDHDRDDCPCRHRWMHVESARRALARLKDKGGAMVRTQNTYVTRRNHTEYRVAAAYEVAADAGWHELAAAARLVPPRTRKPGRAQRRARRDFERAA